MGASTLSRFTLTRAHGQAVAPLGEQTWVRAGSTTVLGALGTGGQRWGGGAPKRKQLRQRHRESSGRGSPLAAGKLGLPCRRAVAESQLNAAAEPARPRPSPRPRLCALLTRGARCRPQGRSRSPSPRGSHPVPCHSARLLCLLPGVTRKNHTCVLLRSPHAGTARERAEPLVPCGAH